MAIQPLALLPDPPLPTDAEEVFDGKAGATLTAQQYMVNVDFNTKLIPAINAATLQITADKGDSAASALAAANSAAAAADSATAATTNGAAQVQLAADQVELAAGKVTLAADQVALATTQANNAAGSAASAQVSAAAAQDAAGLPALSGKAGKVLTVDLGETTVSFQAGLPSMQGNAGLLLQVGQAGAAAQWVRLGTFHAVDERVSGVGGGVQAVNTYLPRVLNTVRVNTLVGASLAGNLITLPPGTYRIRAFAPGNSVSLHKARLYNTTNSTVLAVGESCQAATFGITDNATVFTEVTLLVQSSIRLEHRISTNIQGSNVLGEPCSFGDAECYSQMIVEKVA